MARKTKPAPKVEEPEVPEDAAPEAPADPFAKVYVEGFDHLDPTVYDFDHCYTRQNREAPYNINDVVMAILRTGGNWGAMSILLGRNRNRIKDYVYSHQDVRDIYEDVLGSNLDLIKRNSMAAAILGDGAMQRFYLATLGKDDGFSTRVESTGRGGGPIATTELPDDPQEASKVYQQIISGSK